MKIPIVMVTDANYIFQTRVTIWTMRKNTCIDVLLEITILCSLQLAQISRDKIKSLEAVWPNLKIKFYEVASEVFADAQPVFRIPVASFYRLVIPEVLKKEEKCLFLDGDLIVNTDLRNLFCQKIGDAYLAGVRDSEYLFNPDNAIRHYKEYGFSDFRHYVNAGVMIFNLKKIREDRIESRFLKCMENWYPYMDQDILNKACAGRIRLLAQKYNYFNRCRNISRKPEIGKTDTEEKDWEILHFAGAYKPWESLRIRYAQAWWEYAREALEKEEADRLYAQAEEADVQNDWSWLLGRCRGYSEIVIVGYSRTGIDVFLSLKKCRTSAVLFFGDNSKEKQGLSDENITVYPVEDLAERYPGALWINTSQRSFGEIHMQLRNLGIPEQQIVRYKEKGEVYFEILDDAYIEHELRQMRLKNVGLPLEQEDNP